MRSINRSKTMRFKIPFICTLDMIADKIAAPRGNQPPTKATIIILVKKVSHLSPCQKNGCWFFLKKTSQVNSFF